MTEVSSEVVELKGPLNDEQTARAEALKVARAALGGLGTLPANRGSGDLVWLAEWILEGHPDDDDEPGGEESLRDSDLEWGRKQGRKEALSMAISLAVAAGATDVAAAIRKLEPNDDEAPVCSDTAKDWHCPPFEDAKLDFVASSTPPVPGARKVGGCWVPPTDQYDLPAEQYREAMEAESTTDESPADNSELSTP